MAETFNVVDHICRRCLGRLGESTTSGAFVCMSCGAQAQTLTAACVCGLTVGGLHERRARPTVTRAGRLVITVVDTPITPDRDAGLRCVRNPHPGPTCPAEIVAAMVTPPVPEDAPAGAVRVASGTLKPG